MGRPTSVSGAREAARKERDRKTSRGLNDFSTDTAMQRARLRTRARESRDPKVRQKATDALAAYDAAQKPPRTDPPEAS